MLILLLIIPYIVIGGLTCGFIYDWFPSAVPNKEQISAIVIFWPFIVAYGLLRLSLYIPHVLFWALCGFKYGCVEAFNIAKSCLPSKPTPEVLRKQRVEEVKVDATSSHFMREAEAEVEEMLRSSDAKHGMRV